MEAIYLSDPYFKLVPVFSGIEDSEPSPRAQSVALCEIYPAARHGLKTLKYCLGSIRKIYLQGVRKFSDGLCTSLKTEAKGQGAFHRPPPM